MEKPVFVKIPGISAVPQEPAGHGKSAWSFVRGVAVSADLVIEDRRIVARDTARIVQVVTVAGDGTAQPATGTAGGELDCRAWGIPSWQR